MSQGLRLSPRAGTPLAAPGLRPGRSGDRECLRARQTHRDRFADLALGAPHDSSCWVAERGVAPIPSALICRGACAHCEGGWNDLNPTTILVVFVSLSRPLYLAERTHQPNVPFVAVSNVCSSAPVVGVRSPRLLSSPLLSSPKRRRCVTVELSPTAPGPEPG